MWCENIFTKHTRLNGVLTESINEMNGEVVTTTTEIKFAEKKMMYC